MGGLRQNILLKIKTGFLCHECFKWSPRLRVEMYLVSYIIPSMVTFKVGSTCMQHVFGRNNK